MQGSSLIDVDALTLAFESAPLFSNLSFTISAGEHVALTGPSGSGKSSLLRCLLGFIEPTDGIITLDGHQLDGQSVWHLRHLFGFVPQEADLGEGTARDFLTRPFSYRANSDRRNRLEYIDQYMDAVALHSKLLDAAIESLSGGEKQRIAIVAALLLDRPILLLDEVTSALDRQSKERVWQLLAGLQNKTIIGVAHEGEGLPFAERQIALNKEAL